MGDLTRRDSMALLAGTVALAPIWPSFASAGPIFRHGVASGDPTQDSVVLWTRVTTATPDVPVDWELALDPEFHRIAQSGKALARRERDHTVKIVPDQLSPGRIYYYRFRAFGEVSDIGRTRTLPVGHIDRLGIALMSCSNYAMGYFNAFGAIARDPGIDFLLHTGDYIYEYANAFAARSSFYVRPCEPSHEIVTLDDYRQRHAITKTDAQAQAMHATHPLIALWDDHEIYDNAWKGGGEQDPSSMQAHSSARREAAVRAYYEWMPVRDPAPGADPLDFWRSYVFGDLATIVTLETRLSARDRQINLRDYRELLKTPDGRARVEAILADPARQLLSERMKNVLRASLASSVAARQPWRIIGSGTIMAHVNTPSLRKAGLRPDDEPGLALLDKLTDLFWEGENGLPSTDCWDGYGGARQQFYELCKDVGASDLLVLSGDSHRFWANRLTDQNGVDMGVELGTAGVTSPSNFALAGCSDALMAKLDRLYVAANRDVTWVDSAHRGYVRVTLGRKQASADFIAVGASTQRDDQTVLKKLTFERSRKTLAYHD